MYRIACSSANKYAYSDIACFGTLYLRLLHIYLERPEYLVLSPFSGDD